MGPSTSSPFSRHPFTFPRNVPPSAQSRKEEGLLPPPQVQITLMEITEEVSCWDSQGQLWGVSLLPPNPQAPFLTKSSVPNSSSSRTRRTSTETTRKLHPCRSRQTLQVEVVYLAEEPAGREEVEMTKKRTPKREGEEIWEEVLEVETKDPLQLFWQLQHWHQNYYTNGGLVVLYWWSGTV